MVVFTGLWTGCRRKLCERVANRRLAFEIGRDVRLQLASIEDFVAVATLVAWRRYVTAIAVGIELLRSDPVDAALLDGSVGLAARAGGVAAGPAPLVIRLFAATSAPARIAAATLMIAGSLLTRFARFAAGRRSVDNR